MITVRAVLGGIFLFLGREINFLFAGGMAALLAFRMSPLFPATWPQWADYAVIIGVGLLAAASPAINERFAYVVSGFLGGGYFLIEYFQPGVPTIPVLPFIVGSVTGAVIMGLFTDWALMIISSIIGAYFLSDLFRLPPDLKIMASGGLFMAGALTQVIIRRIQQR